MEGTDFARSAWGSNSIYQKPMTWGIFPTSLGFINLLYWTLQCMLHLWLDASLGASLGFINLLYWTLQCMLHLQLDASNVAFLTLFLEKSPAHKEDSFVLHRVSRISINVLLLTLQWMLHLCLLASQETEKQTHPKVQLGAGWWPWLWWTSTHFSTFTFLSEAS